MFKKNSPTEIEYKYPLLKIMKKDSCFFISNNESNKNAAKDLTIINMNTQEELTKQSANNKALLCLYWLIKKKVVNDSIKKEKKENPI